MQVEQEVWVIRVGSDLEWEWVRFGRVAGCGYYFWEKLSLSGKRQRFRGLKFGLN